MSLPAVQIRTYRPADEPGVLALLHQALGDGRAFDRTEAFWRWKHLENCFGSSLLLLAEDGAIRGLRAFMRWEFRAGDRTISAVRAVDTATHPGYRRAGVFSTLTLEAVERARGEGVDLIFNTPNRYSLPGYLKLGWTYVARPQLLVRLLRPLRVIRALAGARLPAEEGAALAPVAPEELRLSTAAGLEGLLEENDRLCAAGIRTIRSPAFIEWRYGRVPSLRYYLLSARGAPASAAAIFRTSIRRGLREVMLCELLASPRGLRETGGMIRALRGAVDADYLVAHARPNSPHWRALLGAGFLPLPRRGPHFTVRPLSAARTTDALRAGNWYLSLGDLELF